jgi:hypothetical protein
MTPILAYSNLEFVAMAADGASLVQGVFRGTAEPKTLFLGGDRCEGLRGSLKFPVDTDMI